MSDQTLHLVQALRNRLQVAIRRITLADLLYGLLLTLGIVSALWLVLVAVEAGFWLETTPRTVLFWLLLAVTLGLVGYFLVLPLLRLTGVLQGPSEEIVARQIGTRYPEVSDRLVNLLDLVEGRSSEAPSLMIDGAVRMLGEPLGTVPFEKVEDFHRAKRVGRLATLPIVGVLVFLLVAPGTFLGASQRLFSPSTHFQRPAPFQIVVEPGEVDLVRGAPLDITVRTPGTQQPRSLTLELNNLDEDLVEEITLLPDSAGLFHHSIVNVRKSMRYRASADPVRTAWYEATVTERPLVRTLQVALDYPNYSGIPSQRLAPNAGDVAALPGTRVSLEVGLGGRDIAEAFVQFDNGALDTLRIDGDRAEGAFRITRPGTYQILLRNAQHLENTDPIIYNLKLLEDAFPSILLLEPSPDAELGDDLRADLRYRINDDFGFARLRLFYRLAESRYGDVQDTFESITLPLEAPRQLDQEGTHTWLLSQETGLDPVPGDVIEYYLQVWDNDSYTGFKSATSSTHRLRLPSLTEKYEELDSEQDAAEEAMEEMLREAESIREEFKELRDELRQKQESDWEDERQLDNLEERQRQMEERVNDLTEQMESITNKMQENNLLDEETLEMYQELQRVAEEINSPELQEALKQLREAMENLNLQQMQDAIENFEFNEQQYQQRLERTLDLFKRLRVQQKLDEAARRAQELAEQQERLAEETKKLDEEGADERGEQEGNEEDEEKGREGEQQDGEKQDGEQQEGEKKDGSDEEGDKQDGEQKEGEQSDAEKREQLAKEQEQSAEEMKKLEEQLEEILKQMEEVRNSPKGDMQEFNEQTKQQNLPQQMQENAEQLRQEQNQSAQQQQQQMQQQLQQMQQQLQQMQAGMQGQQQQVNMEGVRQALSDVLTLSQLQENLRGDLGQAPNDTPRLREFAQKQVELSEGLSTVSDSLQRLSKDIPQMTRAVQQHAGDALRAMGESTEALTERSSRQAVGEQKTSMMHLNELALLLSDLMDQMQNQQAGGQGGQSMQQMMQQLQQMSGQQQKLNEQIQQMLNDMQGNRLGQDAQQRLRQMAAQQDALRRQLKELSRNRELNGKALGDLTKIAEEMEKTIEELQRGGASRRTVQRQQEILTRLLNASKSLRKRGKENKRESKEGESFNRQSPGELTPAEQAEELRRALLRALESGYAPDYEELIKRYFELLQESQPQE